MITEVLHIENVLRNGSGGGGGGSTTPTTLAVTGWNASGSDITSGQCIRLPGMNAAENMPYAEVMSTVEQRPEGIATSTVSNGSSGTFLSYGRYDSTVNTLGKTVGDPIFCSNTGTLTTDITPWVVGYILELDSNATLFLDFIGGAGYRVREKFLSVADAHDGSIPPDTKMTLMSGNGKFDIRKFDGTVSEDVTINWVIPKNINVKVGVKYQVYFFVTESTTPSAQGMAFSLSGYSIGTRDALNNSFGGEIIVTKTGVTESRYDLLVTDMSAKVTIANYAKGELAMLKFYRDHDHADDTYTQDIGVAGIKLFYVERI